MSSMQESHILESIRPIWMNRMIQEMAHGSGLREDFRTQLDQFYDLLIQVVETGDPSWLDSIVVTWAGTQTQTDLEGSAGNLTSFLKETMLLTNQICQETLASEQAYAVLITLSPAFAHAFEKAAQEEMQIKITYLSDQLARVQQTMEKLDRSKSDFIAVAAHELKTPLTLVEGYTAMLRESMDPSLPNSPYLQLIAGILNGTHRLKTIIDDMIDVSMIDNNLLSLNMQPFWLNRLFNVLRQEVQGSVSERQLDLQFIAFAGSDELNFGDPERLLQVFRNILTNAIKFTPDGGKICVDGRKLPGFMEIVINDTGIGIDPDEQTAIFEKFTRLGNSALHSSGKTKFKGGGPGLGLHIARGIIEAHGGAIWVESPGYDEAHQPGSTFHILLPIRTNLADETMAKLFAPLIKTSAKDEESSEP